MADYLNGAGTTECGAKRAKSGHSKSYGIKYIEIGNDEVIFNSDKKKVSGVSLLASAAEWLHKFV